MDDEDDFHSGTFFGAGGIADTKNEKEEVTDTSPGGRAENSSKGRGKGRGQRRSNALRAAAEASGQEPASARKKRAGARR